jgi:hypothetical protein
MISIQGSDEMKAVVLALKGMDGTLRKRIYAETRSKIAPEWTEALASRANTSLEQKVLLTGARVQLSPERVTLTAGKGNKRLSGGATISQLTAAVEFGAETRKQTIAGRSRKGKAYTYKRTVNTQFKNRRRQGYVAYHVAAEMAPRFAALWVQTAVKTMYDAFEGKS